MLIDRTKLIILISYKIHLGNGGEGTCQIVGRSDRWRHLYLWGGYIEMAMMKIERVVRGKTEI